MPTNAKVYRKFFEKIPDSFSGTFIDLGSGWGHVLFAFAKKFPNSKVIGYEISLLPFFFSVIRVKIFRIKNIIIYRKNFMKASIQEGDFIFCYLCRASMPQIENKIKKELKPSALFVSNCFSLSGQKKFEVITADDFFQTSLFFYKKSDLQ